MRSSRHSRTKATLAFSGAFAVAVALGAVFVLYDFDSPDSPGMFVEVVALMIAMLAFLALLVAGGISAFEAALFARLERGEGTIARWTVDPTTWRECLDLRATLDRQPGVLPTVPAIPREAPLAGIAVIVNKDAVFVGPDAWHPLDSMTGVRASLQGSWLELETFSDESQTHRIRIPVARGAHSEAERVVRHFNSIYDQMARSQAEARARPTPGNRLLTWVEGHFVSVLLLFFFVLIPAAVGFAWLVSLWYPSPD